MTVYAGRMPPAELREAIGATLMACQEHQFVRVLADCSRLDGGHSVLDLYDAAASIGAIPGSARLKEAVLVPAAAAAAGNVEFWETTAINRGIRVRLFTDRTEALAWLTAD